MLEFISLAFQLIIFFSFPVIVITYNVYRILAGLVTRARNTMASQIEQAREKEEEVNRLQAEVNKLVNENNEQKIMIERQLSKDIERSVKGKCNNVKDPIQLVKLADRCKSIYDNEWRDVMKNSFSNDLEAIGIKFLSKILEECQKFSQGVVKEQLTRFVNPHGHEEHLSFSEVFDDEEQHNLLKLFQKIGLRESNEKEISKLFLEKCKSTEYFKEAIKKQYISAEDECLGNYIKRCCKLCWHAALSDPQILLKFDVVGKPEKEINKIFIPYRLSCKVDDNDQCQIGTVKQVVWPAVICKNGEKDILIGNAKGMVVMCTDSAV